MIVNSSLRNAVRAAILHGNSLCDIKPERWAQTYHTSSEVVRMAWESALTELSRIPSNTCEVPDGK